MASRIFKSSLALITLSILAACGGGGSGGNSSKSSSKNQAPTLAQISPLDVKERDVFTITANASDSDGSISSYSWKQVSGTTLELTVSDGATAEFVAPSVDEDETITLSVTVTDNNGGSATQEVSVSIGAYQNLSELTFDDNALKQCLDANGISDVGYEIITCSNNSLMSLSDLSHFENLKQLTIESAQLTDIDALTDKATITHLKLKGSSVEDLTPINTLVQLESLELYDAWLREWRSNSLSGLNFENQTGLKKLVLSNSNNYYRTQFDTEKLIKAVGLSSLELKSVYMVNSEHLSKLDNLTSLALENSFNDSNSLSFLLNKDNITTLILKEIPVSDFSALGTLSNLKELTIHTTSSTPDYSAIYTLEKLESLELSKRYQHGGGFSLDQTSSKETIKTLKTTNIAVEGLESLPEFVSLEELTLSNAGITSVFQISKLQSLKRLEIAGNHQLNDISPLIDLHSLTYLNLSDNRQITELSSLKNMTQLESLVLTNVSSNITLDVLANLTSLKNIVLTNSYHSSLDVLADVTSLESIVIDNTYKIDTIRSLEKLVNLESIVVQRSELKDLSFIKDNLNLKSIDVSVNKLENLDDLEKLTKLERLYLLNSPALSNVEGVSALSELKELEISHNGLITDLNALENTIKLEVLKLSYLSEIDDVSALNNLKNLYHVELHNFASLLCDSVNSLIDSRPNTSVSYGSFCVSNPINWDIIESEQLKQCIKNGSREINEVRYFSCTVDKTSTLAGLEQFTKLETMDLYGIKVEMDLTPLSELSLLTNITFRQFGLKTFPDFRELSNLMYLNVSGNSLETFNASRLPSSITSIAVDGVLTQLDFNKYLPKVTYINFEYNDIKTVTGIDNLPVLNTVYISYNKLSSLNVFYNSNLHRISVYGNNDLTCEDIKGLRENSPSVYISHWMSCN